MKTGRRRDAEFEALARRSEKWPAHVTERDALVALVRGILETMELHGRSSVVHVEPKTMREWALALRAALKDGVVLSSQAALRGSVDVASSVLTKAGRR